MAVRTYGEIPGFPVGARFVNRVSLAKSKVHRPRQGGICGGTDGAESIVVSGGYIDDEDYGDELVYTGQGGNDPATKRQIADQELTRGNAGLARSQLDGRPVRVIRGAGGDPKYSPAKGLRYDGLFRVVDHWHEIGKDGYRIWRFRLVTLNSADLPPAPTDEDGRAERVTTVVQRLIRSSKKAIQVKVWHDFTCQVCSLRIITPAGPYAEAAHIRALGKPHDGPDVEANVLCLCPNDHVRFDAGAIYVDPAWVVRDSSTNAEIGPLRRSPAHHIDPAQLAYHREHHVP
ncbi:SRA-YDG domain-containing protein [Micromonospora sp. WMMA2032]|uniref:YDG/SRA domain-containing protein n=1 Tax=Micromonospora sp. WMMA2032 TaxID=2039870 RepID=UPI000C05A846|nr:YDG/SRA domain-containing protein [Micromonospora sp. WMMA2032]ATO15402.1 SRA-YDG domain-containing protein [Micromonospora sp. WMMA2032]